MEEVDKRLLNILQWDFPLDERPFKAIGRALGIEEEEVIARVKGLKEEGIIRQISAIFDTRRLGYRSALIAMQVEEESIDEVASEINRHPGVSHNYKRDHMFNLWFTLTVPPQESIRDAVAQMARLKGVRRYRILPTKRLFKVGVKLNMTEDDPESPKPSDQPKRLSLSPQRLSQQDISLIQELQKDIEVVPYPFSGMAQRLGINEKEFLKAAKVLEEGGIMRRFAAILRHQKAGFVANGMVCWKISEDRIEEVGNLAASFPQVSHCYQRPTYPDWPYNLFTMIHARSREACERVAKEISHLTGITDYVILYSTKEYKKERVQYFV